MPDTLTAQSPLSGFATTIGAVEIREITDQAIVSLSCGPEQQKSLNAAVKKAYGLSLPASGHCATAKGHMIFSTGADQWFLFFPQGDDTQPAHTVAKTLGEGFAVTDQSDSYANLEVSHAREALARICMLNLSDENLPSGSAARTVMEHMAAFILRPTADDKHLLIASRSSAHSFLHAVETSAKNIL